MTVFEYTHDYAVNSSALKAIFYNENTETLVVRFNNDKYLGYEKVDSDLLNKIVESNSPGRSYNVYLRGSQEHESFDVTSVKDIHPVSTVNNFNDLRSKEFTVTIKFKASNIIEAATKVHGFTSEAFSIISLSEV